MTFARAFAWAAVCWSALVAFDYFFWLVQGENFWLITGAIPLALSFIGLRGTYGNPRLTWLAAAGLALFIFAPAMLGVFFAPAALFMLLAVIADVFFVRRSQSATINGGRA